MAIADGSGLRLAPQQPSGGGACFELWLRLADVAMEVDSSRAEADMPTTVRMRVLLVEDEELILRAMGRILRKTGCETVECRDGTSAVEALSPDFDAVIADHNLPGRGGASVLRAAAECCPDAQLILASGHDLTLSEEQKAHGVRLLLKPFSRATLLRMLKS